MRLYHFVILFLISLSCICIPTTKYSLEVMKMKDESCSLSLYLCFISVQYGIKIIWTSLLNKLHPIDGFKLSKDEHIVSWIAWWMSAFFDSAKNRGRTQHIQAVYSKNQTKHQKRKKKPRKEQASHNKEHPKNSEKRDFPSFQKLLRPLYKWSDREIPQTLVWQFFIFEGPLVVLSPNALK